MTTALTNTFAEQVAQFKDRDDLSALANAVPYARFLGISLNRIDNELIGKLSYSEPLIGNPALPSLHGGTLAGLLESTAIFKLMWESKTVVVPKTITITVDYLRPGKPVDTYAKGTITKQGHRVVSIRCEAWQKDPLRPIAISNAHFLVIPKA